MLTCSRQHAEMLNGSFICYHNVMHVNILTLDTDREIETNVSASFVNMKTLYTKASMVTCYVHT